MLHHHQQEISRYQRESPAFKELVEIYRHISTMESDARMRRASYADWAVFWSYVFHYSGHPERVDALIQRLRWEPMPGPHASAALPNAPAEEIESYLGRLRHYVVRGCTAAVSPALRD